ISLPFLCGIVLGEMLPDEMLPHPEQRLVTTLFLGTALAISSVKIVAMTVRELNFMRRTLGQVIVAAAIIDDTSGWIIMAIILGLASHGRIDLDSLGQSVFGTLLFLAASFTIGRRAVSLLIRWANDNLVSDVPVITTILVVMGVMALITHAIGVHTILGAFVAGMLVGQSPILTRHIDEQLRGLIVALFMPVFFGMAGLSANLDVLADPPMLRWSLARVAMRPEEEARLEREAFEAEGFVTNMERLLVAVDDSPSGRLASRLTGLLAGSRRIPTTILPSQPRLRSRRKKRS